MNKGELIGRIAKETRCSKNTAGKILDAVMETILESLRKGQNVTLVGFGTFTTTERKARKGRDPQTKKEIKIPAKRVPKFRAGKELKAAVSKR